MSEFAAHSAYQHCQKLVECLPGRPQLHKEVSERGGVRMEKEGGREEGEGEGEGRRELGREGGCSYVAQGTSTQYILYS